MVWKKIGKEVLSNKERNTGIRDNISYLSKAMDGNEEDSSEVGKAKSSFLENYKDMLFSKQINSTGMFSTPHVLNIGTPISYNASNSSIRSPCASAEL